jgi:hypothetical protein
MKKYLLGIFAIVIAVSLSAFTSSAKHSASSKTLDGFYWYMVDDASGLAKVSSPAFGGAQATQTFADTHSPCDAGSTRDCIRGYSSQLTADESSEGQAIPVEKP